MKVPTKLMLKAAQEAFADPIRRVPAQYTTNTTAGMVQRRMVTPGEEHYLTDHGIDALAKSGFDVTRDERPGRVSAQFARSLGRYGLDFVEFDLGQHALYYPDAPLRLARGMLKVPGVITVEWKCTVCGTAASKHDGPDAALTAAFAHKSDVHELN